ncbi:hypothetical protein ACKKBF_B20360 [Auxenochlorella protothecoides x Auxenochlorella symbiontica]
MDPDEDIVSIRRLPEDDLNVREVRISCPDATGLGVDLTRVLLDFGLRILQGDISTDGKWCFMVFRVQLSSGVPPRWQLLRARLGSMCPNGTAALDALWRWRSLPKEHPPFLLQVASYDRQGMLHSLTHVLWESDATVFKAHITTSPSGDVADMFWLYDNRNELPEHHRALEICDRVKGVLGPDTECSISLAPLDSIAEGPSLVRRKACKDAVSFSNLRSIMTRRRTAERPVPVPVPAEVSPRLAGAAAAARDAWSDRPSAVTVSVDNETSPSYTMLSLECADRKGLLYDILRALKGVDLRVAYGRLEVDEDGAGLGVTIDIFIQDNDLCRINDPDALEEVKRRVELAVTLPVRITLRDVFDACCTELVVTAPLDTGGRGRPRVTFDVTQALSVAGLGVFMADVFIESVSMDADEGEAQELHRFLIHLPNGQPIRSDRDKKAVYDVVKAQLLGSRLEVHPPSPPSGAGPGGKGGLRRVTSELHEVPSSLLRNLEDRWQFG